MTLKLPADWTTQEVCDWLVSEGLGDTSTIESFQDEELDGPSMLELTERMVEKLFPKMKMQVSFNRARKLLIMSKSSEIACDEGQSELLQAAPSTPPRQVSSDLGNHSPLVFSKLWPTGAYQLPSFPPLIERALKDKSSIFKNRSKSSIRNGLVQDPFDYISRVTLYPTRTQYTDVLGKLCLVYPFLRDSSTSGYELLLECLRNKFKKSRIPLVSVSEVQKAKNKYGSPGNGRKRKANFSEDLTKKNWRPCIMDEQMSEDAYSMSKHHDVMVKEMEKVRPNLEIIKDLMSRTVHSRVEALEKMSTSEVVQEFPYLRIPSLLLHEMELRFSLSPQLAMDRNMQTYAPKLIQTAAESPFKAHLVQLLNELLEDEHKKELEMTAAAMLIPSIFKEDRDLLFTYTDKVSEPTPVLKLSGGSRDSVKFEESVTILMDGQPITRGTNLSIPDAIITLMATYFVYGVAYPKKLKNTLIFIENCLIECTISKVPVTVLRMKNQLLKCIC